MLTVILRNGKKLVYNRAHFVNHDDRQATLREASGATNFEAIIPLDAIERIDGRSPCRITHELTGWKPRRPPAPKA